MKYMRYRSSAGNPFIGIASQRGFTLIEMLIVIAVLGIILAVGLTTFARESRVSAVRQQAIELQSDLESLRSNAIRYNADATFEILSTTSYRLTLPTGDAVTPTRQVTRDWTNTGVSFTDGIDLRYVAPNGELRTLAGADLTAVTPFALSLGDIDYYVKVIGVTGRAMLSATN
jgi:type IV pilus assembly protein PilA